MGKKTKLLYLYNYVTHLFGGKGKACPFQHNIQNVIHYEANYDIVYMH